jgi:hypothetical protein
MRNTLLPSVLQPIPKHISVISEVPVWHDAILYQPRPELPRPLIEALPATANAITSLLNLQLGRRLDAPRGQNTDMPLTVVNSSRAAIAATELPAASSRGPQAHSVPCRGITASMPPPTPLLASSPTR